MNFTNLDMAKTRLVNKHPFFATVLLSMPLVETKILPNGRANPTMAVNGVNIFYNANFVATLTVPDLMFVLAHEVMHIVLLHPWRRQLRDAIKWNWAGDHVLNNILIDSGFEASASLRGNGKTTGILCDPKARGKTTEEWYRHNDDEEPQGNGVLGDDIMDAPGSPADQSKSLSEIKVTISQAAAIARQQGKLSASLSKLVDEAIEVKKSWREELRLYMTAILKNDQSWAKGQRRFLAQGLYLPSMHTPGMGVVAVIVDTSGSVYDWAQEFLAEVQDICTDCKPEEIHVIQVDSQLQKVDVYEAGDTLSAEIKGGGGTDMRPGLQYLDDNDIVPVVMICLTDLEMDFPSEPDYPVIWAATTDHSIPYGDVVRL